MKIKIQCLYQISPFNHKKQITILYFYKNHIKPNANALEDCVIGRGIGALINKHKCNSHLFYTLLNLKSRFDISDGEGTIFGSITKDNLHNMEVIYSENEIRRFEKNAKPIDDCIKNYSIQNQQLTELKSLLLSKMAREN